MKEKDKRRKGMADPRVLKEIKINTTSQIRMDVNGVKRRIAAHGDVDTPTSIFLK